MTRKTNSPEQIEPCPCCQSANLKHWPGGIVNCQDCGLRAVSPEAWNIRPSAQPSTEAVKLADELAEKVTAWFHGRRVAGSLACLVASNFEEIDRALRQSPPLPSGDERHRQMIAGFEELLRVTKPNSNVARLYRDTIRALSKMRATGG